MKCPCSFPLFLFPFFPYKQLPVEHGKLMAHGQQGTVSLSPCVAVGAALDKPERCSELLPGTGRQRGYHGWLALPFRSAA